MRFLANCLKRGDLAERCLLFALTPVLQIHFWASDVMDGARTAILNDQGILKIEMILK